jgi:DNA-directed RNA polymerase specialized sigma24 family protein
VEHSSVVLEKCEQALVLAAKGGDEAAFRALVEPLSRELSAYAYRMVGGYPSPKAATP